MIWPRKERFVEPVQPAPERIPAPSPPAESGVADLPDLVDAARAQWETVQWETVLAELEEQLSVAVLQNRGWVPPMNLSPLPEALRERAKNLAELQNQMIQALQTSRESTATELGTLKTVQRDAPAIYLDVMG